MSHLNDTNWVLWFNCWYCCRCRQFVTDSLTLTSSDDDAVANICRKWFYTCTNLRCKMCTKIVINGCDTVPRWSFAVRLGSKQFCRNLYQETIIAMYFINNGNAVKMLHKIYEQQQQIQHNMFINEFWCYFFSSFIHIMSVLFFIYFHFIFVFVSKVFTTLSSIEWVRLKRISAQQNNYRKAKKKL